MPSPVVRPDRADVQAVVPRAIIERLGLARPVYRETTNYGHFGRPGLPWERDE